MKELDREATRPAEISSEDPATGEILGTVPNMGVAQVGAAVASAREAFPGWKAIGHAGRARHLYAWRDAFVRRKDEVARLLTRENGKPLAESLTEVLAAAEFLAYYAKHAGRLLADRPITVWNPLMASQRTFMAYEPKGVIAVISPWNYPILLAMAELAAALAAGNTAVLKPSELTPLTGKLLGELAREAGLPPGVMQVVTGDGHTGAALTAAPVDRVCFTGSVATGKRVAIAAMERLVPTTLELGGKDPALVLPDVDLDFAARGITWAGLVNAGQVCASSERVYVHRDVAEAFVGKLVARVEALSVGNGLYPRTEIGPIISDAQLARVEAQVADAVAKGATVRTGGKRLEGPGRFYAPTVLTGVTDQMLVMQEETFGPLLPVVVVQDEAEMVARANDSPFGLSATVWTRDTARGERLARELKAGSVWVNTGIASYGNPLTPRGGFKESGIGKIGGEAGLMEMVDAKLVDVQRHGKVPPWWYPTWPGAVAFFEAGIDLLHGPDLGTRAGALGKFLRNWPRG